MKIISLIRTIYGIEYFSHIYIYIYIYIYFICLTTVFLVFPSPQINLYKLIVIWDLFNALIGHDRSFFTKCNLFPIIFLIVLIDFLVLKF